MRARIKAMAAAYRWRRDRRAAVYAKVDEADRRLRRGEWENRD